MSEKGLIVTLVPQKWWTKLLCFIGWHHWVNREPNRHELCYGTFMGPMDWQQCDRCGVEEDPRCDECKENGTGTCAYRIHQEIREQQLRDNCCIHCPKEPHEHFCLH